MKLLVLAQTPPPVHGQSVMVSTLVAGLPARGIAVEHVNLGLSRDAADIGRWRPGKFFALLGACMRAVAARRRAGADTLYYVPAPGKRGALYRDWLVMLLCRPFYKRVVLHWHAAGLADWLATRGRGWERWLSHRLLGGADLALVLSDCLRADADAFAPKKIRTVPNGIPDPGHDRDRQANAAGPFQVLFLGLCCEEKGLFAAAAAVLAANRAVRAPKAGPRFTLVAAGAFADFPTARRFDDLCAQHPAALRYAGQVQGAAKEELLTASNCLCLPTTYPLEGQPLVLLEAMAHDLPVVATRWRAIPDTLPPEAILVEPGDAEALTQALLQLRREPPPAGVFRRHFLAHYTTEQHLAALAAALSDG
jgi:glycosyltransferase involved in cell wall biosynthesis